MISVAMCTFNGAKFIAPQLKSILNQSVLPDEIIICDDGSSDSTVNIIKEIIDDNRGMTFNLTLNLTNMGYVKNFEKAVGLCNGEIIFLSDQDDVWYPERIEKMIKPFMEGGNIGLVYSDAAIVDENLKPQGITVFGTRINARLMEGQNRKVAEVVLNPDLKGCLMAFKSNLVPSFLPIPENARELGWGHDHWFAVIAHATTEVCSINSVLMSYRRHEKNSGQDFAGMMRNPGMRKIVLFLKSAFHKHDASGSNNHEMIIARLNLMLTRLKTIKKNNSGVVQNIKVLEEYIYVSEEAISAFQIRGNLRNKNFFRRLPDAYFLLSKGWYGKFFTGFLSFSKDILKK